MRAGHSLTENQSTMMIEDIYESKAYGQKIKISNIDSRIINTLSASNFKDTIVTVSGVVLVRSKKIYRIGHRITDRNSHKRNEVNVLPRRNAND